MGQWPATAQNAAMVLDGARSLAKGLDKLSKPDFWRALAAGERAGAGWLVTPSGALVYSPAGSQVLVGAAQPLGQLGAGAGSLSAGMAGWNDNPYNALATGPEGQVRAKPINLPSSKTIQVDMDHIASGHMTGGARVSPKKDLFPSTWSRLQVERVIRAAYRNAKRVCTQGDRVLVRGTSNGITIEMWVNRVTRTIETAYPFGP